LNPGKIHDLLKAPVDLALLHPKYRSVQVDVFAPGQVGMETGADFEKAAHAPIHLRATRRWLGDSGENLQQRAFARAVPADNAEHFAVFDLEGDVFQGPDDIRGSGWQGARSWERGAGSREQGVRCSTFTSLLPAPCSP